MQVYFLPDLKPKHDGGEPVSQVLLGCSNPVSTYIFLLLYAIYAADVGDYSLHRTGSYLRHSAQNDYVFSDPASPIINQSKMFFCFLFKNLKKSLTLGRI